MRLIDADALYEKVAEWEAQALHMVEMTMHDEDNAEWKRWSTILTERSAFKFDVADAPTIDAVPIVRCQECAHAPVVDGQCEDGFDIKFPDEICPCQCTGDGWYNYIPDPNWFCADGKRKDGADNG